MKRVWGLDAMRATAICLVLLSHFAKGLEIFGVLGVELFFALSGFLIGGLFINELYSTPLLRGLGLFRFLRRRWYRTLPNYYLYLTVFCVLSWSLGSKIPLTLWEYWIFVQNLAWPSGGFFIVSWSLAVEEWFYLIFPSVAALALSLTNSRKFSLTLSMGLMIILPLLYRFFQSPSVNWEYGLRMVVACRLDALIYGVVMAWLRIRRHELFVRLRVAGLPAAAVALGAAFLTNKLEPWTPSELPAVIFTILPLACAILLPAAERLKPGYRFLDVTITYISLWSYSIYLSHAAILELAYHCLSPFVHNTSEKMLVKIGALGIILFISKLTYTYFEMPITKLRDRSRHSEGLGGGGTDQMASVIT